ncbi:MAG TPA: ribonuclease catalytic domain-containing protein [Syntrophobacteraceae bacterium]|nr:ribonuclease catalytic domain-containing protein [Syntrophobacteraceae bacterium]
MTRPGLEEITAGTVLEFFESKQVLCGVCLGVKNQRFTVLTEQNKEMNLSQSRLIHWGGTFLDPGLGRDELVKRLGEMSALRKAFMTRIDVPELWSLLEGEGESYDARALAGFVFNSPVTADHAAALQRVLLEDRLFFQFKDGRFFARSREKVEQRRQEIEREEQREAQLEEGSEWLHALWNRKPRPPLSADSEERFVEILKDFCLHGQESVHISFARELFKRANVPAQQNAAFRMLVRLGIWHEDENLYLLEQNLTPEFPPEIQQAGARIAARDFLSRWDPSRRKDLRDLHTFTVDHSLTRDYDDALSLRTLEDGSYEVGIHIADAAEFVHKEDCLDLEAQERASSIYLPDGRIAMLPVELSEGVCSLKAHEDRFALSFLIRVDPEGTFLEHEIVSSVIRVKEQLTYETVNERCREEPFLRILYELALRFRNQRIARGAILLPLPEIHVYVDSAGMIRIHRYEKEIPGQIMVSEWMIAANYLAAAYLAERGIPTVFRGQGECRPENELVQSRHELFAVYRRRRLFSRAELDTEPRSHCSLALPCYTTITSPIRRYSDLISQRQLKQALGGGEALYTREELQQILARLTATQSKIFYIQRKWTRYWLLKYIEQEDLQIREALVLDQNDRYAHVVIPEFLLETSVPLPEKTRLQQGEMVRIRIDRVNPREDILRVQLAEPPSRPHAE